MAQHRQNHFFSYEQVLEGVPNAYRKKLAIIARGENPSWHVSTTCLTNSLTVKNPSMIYLTKLPLTQRQSALRDFISVKLVSFAFEVME